jgi:hypothetical protein
MPDEPMNRTRLELRADARLSARPPGEEQFQPVIVADPETCLAPFDGPAIFRLPIVLPKVARVTGGNVHVEGSGPVLVSLGAASPVTATGDELRPARCDLRLMPRRFSTGEDFEIPELDFRDFVRFDLWVAVRSEAGRPSELTLKGYVDYLLPVESAAAYLTYVMTQA